MRLIDADILKIHVAAAVLDGNQQHKDNASNLLRAIDSIPTAHDVDKVVVQIRQIQKNYSDNDIENMIDDVVEFVKSGGIE